MKKVIIALSAIVLVATVVIGVTHYYSVRILSATRAYTNFESQYSKGGKDASRHLMSYIYTEEEIDYLYFKDDISKPIGDRIARIALESGKNTKIARIGFLMAGNDVSDLTRMIWFFNRFKNVSFFQGALQNWRQADALIGKLDDLGKKAQDGFKSGKPVDKEELILQINTISNQLTTVQQNFSSQLGVTSRMVDHYVFMADLVISVIILACTALLTGVMLRKLHHSKKVIAAQNQTLTDMNERINKFVYSVTHDLRAPLSSLNGLIMVLEKEKDINKLPEYTSMMKESIQMQDQYIQEVLQTIREGNNSQLQICNLNEIVNEVITQNSFFAEGKKVQFLNELQVWELRSNLMGLKVVFNNLISNAVKYADFSKPEQWIKFKSYKTPKHCVIEIEDNGLGIKPEQKNRIFNKFFKSGFNKKSMGLGLYFTKQAIEEMNGTITVKSSPGSGTSFIVSLPL